LPLDEQRERAPSEQRELTAPWVRTTVKRQVRELREHLSPEDRMLVSLRADESLSWAEVVDVMGISGDPKVVEARLRKRYQRIVEKLRKATLEP
jgi:RNA polymerase sigma-70 factor (ECF subfamily)